MNDLRLQYYCSNCSTILKETHQEFELPHVIEPCPFCGSLLSESLQKKPLAKRTTRPVTTFEQASRIPRLTFDIEKLDSILNFLRPNQTVGIVGDGSQKLIERLCVRAQLPKRYGGFDSSVILIDGGNSSDPYLCINFARQYGLKVDDVLSKIITSRAFTVYQLESLITHELQNAIIKYDAKFVIISDILGMFTDDPYLGPKEIKLILQNIANSISKLKECLVVISISKPTQYDDIISKLFDRTIRISKHRHRLSVEIDDKEPVQIKEAELEMIPQR